MKVFLLLSSVLLAVQLGHSTPLGACPSTNPEVDVRLADSDNCHIFYKCDWGEPVLFDCPADLVFDTVSGDCDYAYNVNCDRTGVVGPGIPDEGDASGPLFDCPEVDGQYALYIPDKTDCSVYYACAHGIAYQQKCADGLYYDGTIWACTYRESAVCFTYKPIEWEDGNTSDGEGTGGNENEGEGPVGDCPAENTPGINVLLPDSKNCAMFYLCDWGAPVAFYCPDNLLFNTATAQCDYPENVVCGGDDVIIPDIPDGDGGIATGPIFECPETNGKYATYIPDKTDCSVYYICDHGVAYQRQCADGLYYDGTIWACTFPEVAKCAEYLPIEWASEEEPDNGSVGEGSTGAGPIGDCPAENTPGVDVLLPDAENCAIFYKCDWGEAVLFDCPDDLLFSVEANKCDHPDNVNCDRSVIVGPPVIPGDSDEENVGGSGPVTACPAHDGLFAVYIADKTDCSIYYSCAHGHAYQMRCPTNLYFNARIWACVPEDQAECGFYNPDGNNGASNEEETVEVPDVEAGAPIGECPAENIPDVDVLLPDSENCAVFYKCDWGVPVLFVCPDDLLFSVEANKCDHAENVNCDRSVVVDPQPPITPEIQPPGGDEAWVGECPAEVVEYDVFLAHRDNPHKFYVCVGSTPVELICPSNLVFDVSKQWCDYA